MSNNEGNIKIIINKWADFWFYNIGVNVIPFDTQKRIPIIYQYDIYQNETIPIELYDQWKRGSKFEKGIAIVLGKVYRGKNKDQYLIGIDIDREKGLREFLTKNNRHTELQKFAEKTIVEQHKDELTKAHIYFYTPIPFPQKTPDSILGIEVKSKGEHGIMFVSPSIHKNGFNYEIIGNAKEPLLLSSKQAIELMRHVDNICIKNGIKYLETEKNRILTEPLKKIIRTLKLEPEFLNIIPEGQRHITMLSFADSLLIKHRNKKNKVILKTFFLLVNDNVCFSPLPENEINSIWESADEFVDDLEIHYQKNISFSEKQSLIENATDQIMSKYRFLTIEHTKEILFYNNNGVYVQGGEIVIETELEETFGFKLITSDITEIKNHVMRQTYVKKEVFDSNIYIINVKNGLLNWKTAELLPHTPDYYSINQKPIIYNRNARPIKFLKFLREVLYLQDIRTAIEIISYTFIRKNLFEYYFILIGTGANGKNVFVGILSHLHGLKNVSNVSLKSLATHRFALAQLENKDINVDTELSKNVDISNLKKLTGTQPVMVERKGKDPYDIELWAKYFFNTNELPIISDNSDARHRREIILSFPHQFEDGKNADPELLSKIKNDEEEMSGILNLVVNSLKVIYDSKKIHIQSTISQRRAKAELTADPVSAFLDMDGWVPSINQAEEYVTKDEFYEDFTKFCNDHKLHVLSYDAYAKKLKKEHNLSNARKIEEDGNGNKKKITIWFVKHFTDEEKASKKDDVEAV